MTGDEMVALLDSWVTDLKAERKSPHTILAYTSGVTTFTRLCGGRTLSRCSTGRPSASSRVAARRWC
ncbi:MAG: hypothetical protein ACRDOK_09380 [Streptosporangiaceae bacterium]